MKKILLTTAISALAIGVSAQSSIDAYQLSQPDLRGTARFMSMGGAFGALGGDLSTLNYNPAGIGVYRSNEIGMTMDINMTSSKMDDGSGKWDKTNVYMNNLGYVGSINLSNDIMPYFQWGFSYSRQASFDRRYRGSYGSLGTSMSNYVANFTNGYSPSDLGQTTYYNPYQQYDLDWFSILAYNAYIVNPVGNTDTYNGLFNEGVTTGDAMFDVVEKGYIDEYTINFGGNFVNTVYWGIGIGITDLDFTQTTNYDEQLDRALVPADRGNAGVTEGRAYYNLSNYKHIDGTGVNFKIGAIFKPVNEFRLGLAFHTPTYYNLSENYDSSIAYSYTTPVGDGTAYSDLAYFDWKLRTPFRMIVSAAGVVGGRFILSADYEFANYRNMRVQDADGYEYDDITDVVKSDYKPVNTFRIGAEFRITPQLSVRAGFVNSSSNVETSVNDGENYVPTAGTNPAYTFDTSTRYITLGLGYRYKGFYVDAAYINKHRESTYRPFTSYEDNGWIYSPYSDFTSNDNNLVLSLGFKF